MSNHPASQAPSSDAEIDRAISALAATNQDLAAKVSQEVESLRARLRTFESKPFPKLVWIDRPEEAEVALATNMPIIEATPSDRKHNVGPRTKRPHVLIEGDNLHALMALQATHKERVDAIYIDPPYNTGNNDFRYNDQFIDENHQHSTWLSFMHKRLILAHGLLRETGVIFVSIDDNEQPNLRLLLDKVFGREHFIGQMVRKNRTGSSAVTNGFSTNHEYVLVYGKTVKAQVVGPAKTDKGYSNPDDDPRGPWTGGDLTLGFTSRQRQNLAYLVLDPKTGVHHPSNPSHIWRYGRGCINCRPGGWSATHWASPTKKTSTPCMRQRVLDGRVLFPSIDDGMLAALHAKVASGHYPEPEGLSLDPSTRWVEGDPSAVDAVFGSGILRGNTTVPSHVVVESNDRLGLVPWHEFEPLVLGTRMRPANKKFAGERKETPQAISSLITSTERDAGSGVLYSAFNGTDEVKAIFGFKAFDYPKPTSLLTSLLSTMPRDAVVLDFFAGSGTTGHAVALLNAADGGTRQAILVTNNEDNICMEVTQPRLERVLTGEGWANAAACEKQGGALGGSLRFYRAKVAIGRSTTSSELGKLSRRIGDLIGLMDNAHEVVKEVPGEWQMRTDDGTSAVLVWPAPSSEGLGEALACAPTTATNRVVYVYSRTNRVDPALGKAHPGWVIRPMPKRIHDALRRVHADLERRDRYEPQGAAQ